MAPVLFFAASCHAMRKIRMPLTSSSTHFSLGGIVGAAGVTGLLVAGASPVTATLVVIGGIAHCAGEGRSAFAPATAARATDLPWRFRTALSCSSAASASFCS